MNQLDREHDMFLGFCFAACRFLQDDELGKSAHNKLFFKNFEHLGVRYEQCLTMYNNPKESLAQRLGRHLRSNGHLQEAITILAGLEGAPTGSNMEELKLPNTCR